MMVIVHYCRVVYLKNIKRTDPKNTHRKEKSLAFLSLLEVTDVNWIFCGSYLQYREVKSFADADGTEFTQQCVIVKLYLNKFGQIFKKEVFPLSY